MNSSGKLVFGFITTNSVIIFNKGNTPTFRNKVREEVIDVTLPNNRNLILD